MEIHPTAIVAPGARLEDGVSVGPYSIIGERVAIGEGTRIGPHVVIDGWTEIGRGCQIFSHAAIGTAPQDLKYRGEETRVSIGDGCTVREYATVNRGTAGGGGLTALGPHTVVMAYAHVAHDCIIGEHVILANLVTLAGHVLIEEHAIIGGITGIHQFVRVGCYAMVGACSAVLQDILPYVKVQGNRAKPYGLNSVGLRRHGFPPEAVRRLKQAYRLLFQSDLNTTQALERIAREVDPCPEVDRLVAFIKGSERGISK